MDADGAPPLAPTLSERLEVLQGDIVATLSDAGRATTSATLIVITKFHPLSMINELFELGIRDFGESRHQEAQVKSEQCAGRDLRWHFIGQLQSKKARAVARYANVIHSVDREHLIEILDSVPVESAQGESERLEAVQGVPVDVFLQVDLASGVNANANANGGGRGGMNVSEVQRLTERVAGSSQLRLMGVMAVAPLGEPPQPAFARLRTISESIIRIVPTARFISAGMSGDYREALREGATHLRIGSAITGLRPAAE